MLTEGQKEKILDAIVESYDHNTLSCDCNSITNPVLLVDNTRTSWIIDATIAHHFQLRDCGEWMHETLHKNIHGRFMLVYVGAGLLEVYQEPCKITEEDLPDFIEQCTDALNMARL